MMLSPDAMFESQMSTAVIVQKRKKKDKVFRKNCKLRHNTPPGERVENEITARQTLLWNTAS